MSDMNLATCDLTVLLTHKAAAQAEGQAVEDRAQPLRRSRDRAEAERRGLQDMRRALPATLADRRERIGEAHRKVAELKAEAESAAARATRPCEHYADRERIERTAAIAVLTSVKVEEARLQARAAEKIVPFIETQIADLDARVAALDGQIADLRKQEAPLQAEARAARDRAAAVDARVAAVFRAMAQQAGVPMPAPAPAPAPAVEPVATMTNEEDFAARRRSLGLVPQPEGRQWPEGHPWAKGNPPPAVAL